MGFLRKLFGSSDRGGPQTSSGHRAFVPGDDSNEQILGCVLQYIWLAESAERQHGRELPKNNNIGPRTTAELDILQRFRRSHGYTYRQMENAFWCSEFIQQYHHLSIEDKVKFLDSLSNDRFLQYVTTGQVSRPEVEADGVVYFLVTIAFDMLGVNVEPYKGGVQGWKAHVL